MRHRSKVYYKSLADATLFEEDFNLRQWMKDNKIKESRFSDCLEDYLYIWYFLDGALPESEREAHKLFGGAK